MIDTLYPDLPVLMVDDESHLLNAFDLTLGMAGVDNTIKCNDSREVEKILSEQKVEIIMLDLSMPFMTGEDVLEVISEKYPEVPVIIITGNNEIETAVQCMKRGAFDYLLKPVEDSRLVSSVKRAIELRELRNENLSLKQRIFSKDIQNREVFEEIVTQNPKMLAMFQYMEAIAQTKEPILITGETGVGKELIAKALNKLSNRTGRFVTTNVAGLDDHMFTDTLFGHKKGAFTNADSDRPGLIEKSAGGTLFLDEIGDLNQQSQVKLLRLLQEHEYYPLGIDEPKYSDALIVVATNQDLYALKEKGKFRNDLFYRLNVHQIEPIPLRKRIDDLPMLLEHFLEQSASELNKLKPTPPPELIMLLSSYHFPGNIRELKAMVFNAVSIHKSKMLSLNSFKEAMKRSSAPAHITEKQNEEELGDLVTFSSRLPTLKQVQVKLVEVAMKRSQNNQSIAAQLLGITRQALNKRLKDKDQQG
jgi:DNA-binding NtrC family response regulator